MKQIELQNYSIWIDPEWKDFQDFVRRLEPTKVGVLVDENTKKYCWPILSEALEIPDWTIIQIPSGEWHKNIQTCTEIWSALLNANFDRNSLLLNLGGGVIGDMGGFCASTYKRGIRFIQMPTTLLSQVDASIGGKLGIDFGQIKNSIGLFNNPELVVANTTFLKTLDNRELRSGFAEIIKHALIADQSLWLSIQSINDLAQVNWEKLLPKALQVKKEVVTIDPFEKGLRKTLNFGHTIGHAIESLLLKTHQPALHGEAIAAGMICESYLAHKTCGLEADQLYEICGFIQDLFGKLILPEGSERALLNYMSHDKKNKEEKILFALIDEIGKANFDRDISTGLIQESLGYYRDLKV